MLLSESKILRFANKTEEYMLQTLKFGSFTMLFVSFLVVNFFSAKPQYFLVKVVTGFSSKIQEVFVAFIDKITNPGTFWLQFISQIKMNLHNEFLEKILTFMRNFFHENIQRMNFIEKWQYCNSFNMKKLNPKIFSQQEYKNLEKFRNDFNYVKDFLERRPKLFNVEWPVMEKKIDSVIELVEHRKAFQNFFSRGFFIRDRVHIWKKYIVLLARTIPLHTAVLMYLCVPIMIRIKKLYEHIKKRQHTIINEMPIVYIRKRRKYSLKDSRLYFSKEKEAEIYSISNMISSFKDFSFCFQGEKGVGKTEVAKYICSQNNGGYMVSLSKLAIMGQEGIRIFHKLIDLCMKTKTTLIIDDSEAVMINRSDLKKTVSEGENKNQENIKAIVVTLLSTLSFNKFNCIFITNSLFEVDEAFARRVYLVKFNRSHKTSFENAVENYLKVSPSLKKQVQRLWDKVSYRSIKLLSILHDENALTRGEIMNLLRDAYIFEIQHHIQNRRKIANVA